MADVRAQWLDTVRRWKLDPNAPATDEYCSPKLETISRDELGAIQGEKLVKAVAYVFERSRLFRRKCEESGLEPGDVRGIEDLTKLPIMTKDDMREDLEGNPRGVGTWLWTSTTGCKAAGRSSKPPAPRQHPVPFLHAV